MSKSALAGGKTVGRSVPISATSVIGSKGRMTNSGRHDLAALNCPIELYGLDSGLSRGDKVKDFKQGAALKSVCQKASKPRRLGLLDADFWKEPRMQTVAALVISVLFHAGLLLAGYLAHRTLFDPPRVERQRILVSSAAIVPDAAVGGTLAAELEPLPEFGKRELSDGRAVMDALAGSEAPLALARLNAGAEGVMTETSGAGMLGMGGGGAGGGEVAAPFGMPGGAAGSAPRSPFMGISGDAYRLAYVCDASGTMVTARVKLVEELKRSIEQLKPVQFFNIFFFRGSGFEAFHPRQLVPATPQNKQAVNAPGTGWIDATYQTSLDGTPIAALQAAMEQNPQLIYLLTDGLEDGSESAELARSVRGEIQRMNRDGVVRINTILLEREELARYRRMARLGSVERESLRRHEVLAEILKAIAADNGGIFKTVSFDQNH